MQTLVVEVDMVLVPTFTGAGSTSIESRGYDKNGYQSIGTSVEHIVARKVDTISFHNDTINELNFLGIYGRLDISNR